MLFRPHITFIVLLTCSWAACQRQCCRTICTSLQCTLVCTWQISSGFGWRRNYNSSNCAFGCLQFFRESFSAKNDSIYGSNNTCSVTMWELIARFMCLPSKIWRVVAGPYNWESTQASSRPLPSMKEPIALRLHRTVSNSRNMYLSWSSGLKAWSKLYNLYVQVHLKCDHCFFFQGPWCVCWYAVTVKGQWTMCCIHVQVMISVAKRK